jgi:pyruvyltransferase
MKVVKVHQRWTTVLDMIANNWTHVASSSLHGMIVADAMGLPYVWFQAKRSPVEATQGQFKYRDYLQSVGRMSEKPLNLTRFLTSPAYYYTPISLQDRNKIIERTLESFPFHLFESQPGMAKGRALRAVPLDPKTIVSKQGTLQQATKSQNRCKIRFKDPTMAICNFVPYKIIKGNFGDLLGPATVLRLLEQHFQCDSSEIKNHDIASDGYPKNDGKCLFHLGSVMHFVRPGDSVWGTGINPLRLPRYRGITLNLTKVTFYSVRGPDTLKFIQQDASRSDVASLPFGDPGFLIPFLYPKFMPKTTQESVGNKRFCFIPHAQDRHRVLPPGIQVIPVSQQWTKVVEVVSSSCTHVAASSLHGMIIADAMGLPSLWFQWINSKTDRTEGAFKYVDYLKSVGRKVKTPIWRENQLSDPSSYYQPFSLKERKETADRTIASFPFDLFESFT